MAITLTGPWNHNVTAMNGGARSRNEYLVAAAVEFVDEPISQAGMTAANMSAEKGDSGELFGTLDVPENPDAQRIREEGRAASATRGRVTVRDEAGGTFADVEIYDVASWNAFLSRPAIADDLRRLD